MADPYLTDEERVEQLKEWWKKNGFMVVMGVVLGVVLVFGWKTWVRSKQDTAVAASVEFEQLRLILSKRLPAALQKKDPKKPAKEELAVTKARDIMSRFPATPYAIDSAMVLAKISVEKNDLKKAETYLQWALENSGKGSYKYHLVNLRLARVLRDQGQYQKAMQLLAVKNTGKYRKYYDFIKGTVYEEMKQCSLAQAAYQNSIRIISAEQGALQDKSSGRARSQDNLKQLIEYRLENVKNC